jgi:hypothetical protein
VKEVISFTDEASGSEILVMPNDHYSVTAMVDFGTKIQVKCNDEKYLIKPKYQSLELQFFT